MSLDVYISELVKDENNEDTMVTHYEANITHNLNKMAMECGLYEPIWRPYLLFKNELNAYLEEKQDEFPNDFNPKAYEYRFESTFQILAKQITLAVENGLVNLIDNKEELLKYEPENGWGTYNNLVEFTTKYLAKLKQFPDCIIIVDR